MSFALGEGYGKVFRGGPRALFFSLSFFFFFTSLCKHGVCSASPVLSLWAGIDPSWKGKSWMSVVALIPKAFWG